MGCRIAERRRSVMWVGPFVVSIWVIALCHVVLLLGQWMKCSLVSGDALHFGQRWCGGSLDWLLCAFVGSQW